LRWQGGHGRWSLGGAMGDPTAVGRCTGGLLDGRWSGGGGLGCPGPPQVLISCNLLSVLPDFFVVHVLLLTHVFMYNGICLHHS